MRLPRRPRHLRAAAQRPPLHVPRRVCLPSRCDPLGLPLLTHLMRWPSHLQATLPAAICRWFDRTLSRVRRPYSRSYQWLMRLTRAPRRRAHSPPALAQPPAILLHMPSRTHHPRLVPLPSASTQAARSWRSPLASCGAPSSIGMPMTPVASRVPHSSSQWPRSRRCATSILSKRPTSSGFGGACLPPAPLLTTCPGRPRGLLAAAAPPIGLSRWRASQAVAARAVGAATCPLRRPPGFLNEC